MKVTQKPTRQLHLDSFLTWFGGLVVAAFASGEGAGGVFLFILLAVPVAVVFDYFLTPYMKAAQSGGQSQDEIRRRRIYWTGLTVVLIAIFVIGFTMAPGS